MHLRTCAGGAEPAIGDGWGSAAGGLVRCWCGAGRAPACDDPSLCGGRGVVAHPGAGACGGEEVLAYIVLSFTVGWFTSLFPVRLDAGAIAVAEALGGGPALGQALKLIKEQLRGVPNNGLGYGLLRYLNQQTGSQLARFASPQIGFNYLGRFTGGLAADWARAPEAVRLGGGGDAGMPLAQIGRAHV